MSRFVYNFRKFEKELLQRRRDRIARRKTIQLIRQLEYENGKVDPKIFKRCNEYALEVLGSERFAHGLWFYSTIAGEFKEGWVPENYYFRVVNPIIKGPYEILSELKSPQSRIFDSEAFPDIAYYVNGLWLDRDYHPIPESGLQNVLFGNSEKIVFKQDLYGRGTGIYFYTEKSFDTSKIRRLGNGVFQSYISQHEFFNQFTTTSVATIRLNSVIEKSGEASIRGCALRLGSKHDTHVNQHSGVRVAVDAKTGQLSSIAYDRSWRSYDRHPDTNVSFDNKQIPFFDDCKREVLRLHNQIPQVGSVGWDLVVDNQNSVKIMEWNGTVNGISFNEATQGPGFLGLGWEQLWKKELR